MNTQDKSTFVYVTYIRTTPEKLWDKLTLTGAPREFFWATVMTSDLKAGSPWKQEAPDGTLLDSGQVLEIDPPKKLVLSWNNHYKPEMKAEGEARMTYSIEPQDGMVKLTVLHEINVSDSKLIVGVSKGWPVILSSLKSLLETGEPLEDTRSF
jgi:uncharacterized protein YndB with AHSA1/START domain